VNMILKINFLLESQKPKLMLFLGNSLCWSF